MLSRQPPLPTVPAPGQPAQACSAFLVPAAVMAIIGIAMGGYSDPSMVVGVLDRAGTSASGSLSAASRPISRCASARTPIRRNCASPCSAAGWTRGSSFRLGGEVTDDLEVYLSPANAEAPVLEAMINADLSLSLADKNARRNSRLPGRRTRRGSPARLSVHRTCESGAVRDHQWIHLRTRHH